MGEPIDPARFVANRLAVRLAALTRSTEVAIFSIDAKKQGPNRAELLYHIRPDRSDSETRGEAIAAFKMLVSQCLDLGKSSYIRVAQDQWCMTTVFPVEGVICGAAAFITRSVDEATVAQRLSVLNGTFKRGSETGFLEPDRP
jgi:hypothetical protein